MITQLTKLLDAVSATGAGPAVSASGTVEFARTFQLIVSGANPVSGTCEIQVSNDGENWIPTPLGTITVSGTGTQTDGFTSNANWGFYRANLTALGVGDTATLIMGG